MSKFENNRNYITIIIFLGILILPKPAYLLLQDIFPNVNTENRRLAEMPTLEQSGTAYLQDFSQYFNDNLPFRSAMKKFYSQSNYLIFHDTNDSVLVGKDGWLFYRDKNDASPVRQVQSKDHYSEAEMTSFKNVISDNFAYADKINADLYYLVLPNKENIYRDYLPDSVNIYHDISNTEEYLEYLNNEKIIFPKAELLTAKNREQIYFKTDSHWNNLGAFVGHQSLSRAIWGTAPSADSLQVETREGYYGDLLKASGIGSGIFQDDFPVVTYKGISSKENDTMPERIITCEATDAEHDKTLLFIGDSYRLALTQYLCADYRRAIIVHRDIYTDELIQEYRPDIIVIEYVERYFNHSIPLQTSPQNP